jgi:hypothetical protein
MHEAIAARLSLEEGRWYHLAATSDGQDLKLFVDRQDGRGYQLQAAAGLPRTGRTALGKSSDDASWSIGRGLGPGGMPGEWLQGWIDEVRISDTARQPDEFLFALPRGGEGPRQASRAAPSPRAGGFSGHRPWQSREIIAGDETKCFTETLILAILRE